MVGVCPPKDILKLCHKDTGAADDYSYTRSQEKVRRVQGGTALMLDAVTLGSA